ncbi:MAG: flagellar hook-associated protein FlgL [Clostridia bacterium]|nr:flagellar hook-associated protein FlgL [Clostridia bacterium]
MRLTNMMMINNLMYNLGKTSKNVYKYSNQIQTGKQFQFPSDAPVNAAKSIRYKTDISKVEQYQKNTEDANEILKATESAINSYNEILGRVKELSTQAANTTYGINDMQAIREEVEQLKAEVVRIANTEYNGKYLFSGYKTDQRLLNDDGTYNIDVIIKDGMYEENGEMVEKTEETINYDIGFGGKLQVNTLGPNVFGKADVGEKAGIIGVFDQLIAGLASDDKTMIRQAGGAVEDYQQVELDALADIGARMNRLALTQNRLTSSLSDLEEALSLNEDIDYAEVITKLASEKSVYNASLMTGAKVIQKSLIDFL